MSEVGGVIIGGVYRHYKHTDENPKYYQVETFARHTENREVLVVYRPLYLSDDPLFSARPIELFTGLTQVNGKSMVRFVFVGMEVPS